jgi:hypothetical protein
MWQAGRSQAGFGLRCNRPQPAYDPGLLSVRGGNACWIAVTYASTALNGQQ